MIDELIKILKRLINPPKVVIRIDNGNAITAKGKVSKVCLNECSIFFRDNDIQKGKIYISENDYGQKLEFSRGIPEHIHQRIRNLWNFHN